MLFCNLSTVVVFCFRFFVAPFCSFLHDLPVTLFVSYVSVCIATWSTCVSSIAGTHGVNVYSVADKMAKRGWSLNSLQSPACVHICCTVAHVGKSKQFLADLEQSLAEVIASPDVREGNAAIYGLTSALPPGPVNELLKVYNDVVLKV
jgi:hypothetical protein